MLRPSPNQMTLRLPNDVDMKLLYLTHDISSCIIHKPKLFSEMLLHLIVSLVLFPLCSSQVARDAGSRCPDAPFV